MEYPNGAAREACERTLARTADAAARSTMITVTDERARREADRSDRRRRDDALLGPLDGVLVVWKDLFDVAGTVTTCGSASLADDPPARADGALVRRCASLGMVTVGKTNLSEFAFSGLGINQHFGTPVSARSRSCPRRIFLRCCRRRRHWHRTAGRRDRYLRLDPHPGNLHGMRRIPGQP